MCLEYLENELKANERMKKDVIVKERDLLCVCKAFIPHNLTTLHVMPCCSVMFNMACITDFLNKYIWCLFCGSEPKTNNTLLSSGEDNVGEIGSDIANEQTKERANDVMWEQSIQKKRKFQENQGEKMKNRYKERMKDCSK